MARSRRKKKGRGTTHDDPVVKTKKWLRSQTMDAVRWWAPMLRLGAFVDTISVYITKPDDKEMSEDEVAQVTIESSRRTADIRIKQNCVASFASDYANEDYSAEEIVEMTIIHELCHVFTNPMSEWAHSSMTGNVDVLTALFAKEEEVCVEHLTRVLFGLKDYIKDPGTFKGKIVYLAKDPWLKEKTKT